MQKNIDKKYKQQVKFELDPPILNCIKGKTSKKNRKMRKCPDIGLKPNFWTNFWHPKYLHFRGSVSNNTNSNSKTIEWNQNVWYQTNCMSRCLASSQIPNFGPNLDLKSPKYGLRKFFNNWYHLNLLDIIAVYHNMQYEKILMSSSWENEFGDKNNLETSLNWAQIWP